MSFHYFAYGSNLWPPQMASRCPSATVTGVATLAGWSPIYDKPSSDGSAKLNIAETPGGVTHGAVYEIDDAESDALDRAEPGYDRIHLEVAMMDGSTLAAVTYRWSGPTPSRQPYDWYVATARAGARLHQLPTEFVSGFLERPGVPDPVCPGLRPATAEDLPAMQNILSASLGHDQRYSIHPGDLAWWMYHDDPRDLHAVSYWMQDGEAILVIDARDSEISAFTVPDRALSPLVNWAQRRLDGRGEVGWISDRDTQSIGFLEADGYEPVSTSRRFRWDLRDGVIPEPILPDGWVIRHLEGEHEAEIRHAASHAAFQSTLEPQAHSQRYLRFMRSPAYAAERDLVAVSPDGRIASFMIWWPDSSGIAQIEPFGAHPDFQNRGIGKALIHHGLRQMRQEGMSLARVCTDESREGATAFYRSAGFSDIDSLRWWKRSEVVAGVAPPG